ncbi:MAG: hypothetical protein ACLRJV_23790 [Eubacteriales bacterium]
MSDDGYEHHLFEAADFRNGLCAVRLGVLPWMLLIVGIARVARKIDSVVARIGLNPAITGDGLGRGLPGMVAFAAIRGLGMAVTRSASAASKGSGGAKPHGGHAAGSSSTPPPSSPPSGVGATRLAAGQVRVAQAAVSLERTGRVNGLHMRQAQARSSLPLLKHRQRRLQRARISPSPEAQAARRTQSQPGIHLFLPSREAVEPVPASASE